MLRLQKEVLTLRTMQVQGGRFESPQWLSQTGRRGAGRALTASAEGSAARLPGCES